MVFSWWHLCFGVAVGLIVWSFVPVILGWLQSRSATTKTDPSVDANAIEAAQILLSPFLSEETAAKVTVEVAQKRWDSRVKQTIKPREVKP